jgi:hypothetical protein
MGALEGAVAAPETPEDGDVARLLKHVPAEILAFLRPAAAAAKTDRRLFGTVFAVGLVAAVDG